MANNKTIVSKDILDAMNNIVSNKGNYETSKVWGGDYEQYKNAAAPSYQYLIDNGWGDVADSFKNSTYITAQDVLKRYGLADSATDKASDWVNMNMENWKSFSPNTADTYKNYENGIKSNYTDFTDSANSRYKDTQRYLEPYANNLNDLYGKYSIGVDTVNAQNNQLWGDMRQFGTDQTARYDKLTDYIYTNDYTATPWYQTIMEGYNIKGDNAAGDAIASAGGSNSGNIDSYAAANANRQQLAFTNAGNTAALNAYNSQIGNLLTTIQSLGYDIGNLQNRQQANIDSSRSANQGMLDSYNQGNNILGNVQNDAVANLMNAYGLAGQNYNTGYNNLMGAQNTESQITANAYNDLMSRYTDLDANQKNYDINEMSVKNQAESAKAAAEAETLKAQYDYAAKIYGVDGQILMNQSDNYTKLVGQELTYSLGLSQQEADKVIERMISDRVIQQATIQSAASQSVAGTQANASMYGDWLATTAKNYATEMGYLQNQETNASNEKIAEIKNGQGTASTATYETIQNDLLGLLNGSTDAGKVDINTAQQILLEIYPGSSDRVKAVIKDYTAKTKSDISSDSTDGTPPLQSSSNTR